MSSMPNAFDVSCVDVKYSAVELLRIIDVACFESDQVKAMIATIGILRQEGKASLTVEVVMILHPRHWVIESHRLNKSSRAGISVVLYHTRSGKGTSGGTWVGERVVHKPCCTFIASCERKVSPLADRDLIFAYTILRSYSVAFYYHVVLVSFYYSVLSSAFGLKILSRSTLSSRGGVT